MRIAWDGTTPRADAEAIAQLCHVSVRTVRRHCTPVERHGPQGPGTVQAWYDIDAARAVLAKVKARQRSNG